MLRSENILPALIQCCSLQGERQRAGNSSCAAPGKEWGGVGGVAQRRTGHEARKGTWAETPVASYWASSS